MRRLLVYAGVALVVVTVGVGLAWPFSTAPARRGLIEAAGVALTVQVAAFAIVVWSRARERGWLGALAAGMGLRLVALGVTGVVALRLADRSRTEALVLGFVGFLFILILLEAWFLRGITPSTMQTNQRR